LLDWRSMPAEVTCEHCGASVVTPVDEGFTYF
jgi:hypothetical protein